jgi:hypothetical protein
MLKAALSYAHLLHDFRIIRSNLLEGGNATTDHRLLPYTVFIDPHTRPHR